MFINVPMFDNFKEDENMHRHMYICCVTREIKRKYDKVSRITGISRAQLVRNLIHKCVNRDNIDEALETLKVLDFEKSESGYKSEDLESNSVYKDTQDCKLSTGLCRNESDMFEEWAASYGIPSNIILKGLIYTYPVITDNGYNMLSVDKKQDVVIDVTSTLLSKMENFARMQNEPVNQVANNIIIGDAEIPEGIIDVYHTDKNELMSGDSKKMNLTVYSGINDKETIMNRLISFFSK